jgi:hypothetical protein
MTKKALFVQMSGKTEMSGKTAQEGISKVVKPVQKPMEPAVPKI